MIQQQTSTIQQRDAEIAELKKRLATLEKFVNRLALEGDKMAYVNTRNID
jgi:type II secretory pathway component PulJ